MRNAFGQRERIRSDRLVLLHRNHVVIFSVHDERDVSVGVRPVPAGGERHALRRHSVKTVTHVAVPPAVEHIAGFGRLGGSGNFRSLQRDQGRDRRSAVRIEADGGGLLPRPQRIERQIGGRHFAEPVFGREFLVAVPPGEFEVFLDRISGNDDIRARFKRLACDMRTAVGLERHGVKRLFLTGRHGKGDRKQSQYQK